MEGKRRVVVTGLGMVTPLGLDVVSTWDNVLKGVSGVRAITPDDLDIDAYATRIWARVKDFNPEAYFSPKEARKMDGFTQYGVAASIEAMKDSGFEITESNQYRAGVAVGAGIGGIHTITSNQDKLVSHGPRRVSPFFVPSGIINMVAGQISIYNKLKGPNVSIATACATGTHNIALAHRMIAYGDADMMVAGGAEMTTTPLCLAGFSSAKALSKRNDAPEKASRPWDKDRDGFVMGDGAGVLVLEEYEHAKARGAKIYAELTGAGWTGDAYHITAPDSEAGAAIYGMKAALTDAGFNASDVDYVNAHGTSTQLNDLTETKAIKGALGEHAYDVAISSTKSMTGHLLGAAGAVEAIFSVLAIRDNVIPPTINLDEPGEECDLNYTPHEASQRQVDVALSNSLGFGGTNGTLVFSSLDKKSD